MPLPASSTLSEIAAGAQAHGRGLIAGERPGSDLRGALLLAQIDLMMDAVSAGAKPDGAAGALVESLFLLVDPATKAIAAERLDACATFSTKPVAALPKEEIEGPSSLDDDVPLDAHRLAWLVQDARHDSDLARWLLGRPEPTVQDRAALYRFATPPERADIRAALAERLHAMPANAGSLTSTERAKLLEAHPASDVARWMAEAGFGPSRKALAEGMADEAEQELLALGLLALGFDPDESIRILLAQAQAISRSVAAIRHLATLVRTTPVLVARHIADPDERLPDLACSLRPAHPAAALSEMSRRRPREFTADRLRSRGEASVLPDRRSRATTGPGRT